MVLFPNCKINLGLHVTGKRTDGYHNIETVFYPIFLKDVLEVVTSTQLQFQSTGLPIAGNSNDNLCVKSWHLLRQDFPQLPFVQIHLHKHIPIGAGLGGGSADGASMLLLLNKKYNLQLTTEQLIHYALRLGSDCPFFILNQPVYATGRGEIMQPIQLNLQPYKIHIVNPGIHISTKMAFEHLIPTKPLQPLSDIIQQPVPTWKNVVSNDFEENVFNQFPEIKKIKDDMYDAGAVYASMSGTGSTVYGLFNKSVVTELRFPSQYLHLQLPGS